jgi:cyclopropane fatty-acyl-phospholipid synthase-like methyltransferase
MKPHLTTIDPVWEEKYSAGHAERYPWDCIVTFVYRYYPRDKQKQDVRILEVGCGAGSNLWFAAREGFDVTGIEGSASAIQYAQERFKLENLKGDLRVGDFTALPFTDNTFDLVIDRGSTYLCGPKCWQKSSIRSMASTKKGGLLSCQSLFSEEYELSSWASVRRRVNARHQTWQSHRSRTGLFLLAQ